jgi:hypothetical protein
MSEPYLQNLRLLAAFRHLLVPLVRILVRNGVLYREFADVVKSAYVHVAADENSTASKPASLARVAIVTGLPRHEVLRLFEESERLNEALGSNAQIVARLLRGWHSDSRYVGPYGVPRELKFSTDSPSGLSFSELVRTYAPEMTPSRMLEELHKVGAAKLIGDRKMVRVEQRTYIPEKMAPEQIEVFSRGVRRYIETVDYNLSQPDANQRRFERWVFPDFGIRLKDWAAFRQLVTQRLQHVVQDLDTKFGEFERPEPDAGDELRVGVGMYLYKDEADDERLFRIGSRVVRRDET